jgi:hypothetical protein
MARLLVFVVEALTKKREVIEGEERRVLFSFLIF